VKFGNGDVVESCKKGIFMGAIIQENGNKLQVALEVKYVPDNGVISYLLSAKGGN
jgi:hypothetical protein